MELREAIRQEICIKNYDTLIAEIRKQRRRLVRARYELRKERENAKND